MPDPSPAQIRFATPSDADQIMELIRELAVFEKLEHQLTATADDLRRELADGGRGCEALVAVSTTAPSILVGYAIFFHNFSTFLCRSGLYLEDLYVRAESRGQGIGTQMLERLALIAEERECGRFEWAVLDWNENAIRFYESLGATVMPDWRVVRLDETGIKRLALRDISPKT